MKIGAIIQARTSSTRLPNKVLLNLPYNTNITVLQQVIRRIKKSKLLDEIVVATTTEANDKTIIDIANKEEVKWFKGSKNNVLDRFYKAAKENKLDVVVRITSDCPCIDWNIMDETIESHLKEKADYTSNFIRGNYIRGLDVEVISFKSLEEAYFNAKEDFEKEHVTPYIYRTNPDKFKINSSKPKQRLNYPDIRLTLDTEEDYALLCAIFDYLYYKNNFFETKDILNLFQAKPWLKLINKKVVQKKVFSSLEKELEEAKKILELQNLNKAKEILEKWENKN